MADLGLRLTPESEHLANQERLLEELTEELAAREAALATMTAAFARFRVTYLSRFAPLYAELDRFVAEAARVAAENLSSLGLDDGVAEASVRQSEAQADEAEARARASASAAEAAGAMPAPPEAAAAPTPSLRALYREVAKAVHPDLATDEAEKARRTILMSAASAAYAAGDEATLRRILEDEAMRPEGVVGDDVGLRIVRVLRQIAQVRGRLEALSRLRFDLEVDPMWTLFEKVQAAIALGEDPLEESERDLRRQIRAARARLAALRLRNTSAS